MASSTLLVTLSIHSLPPHHDECHAKLYSTRACHAAAIKLELHDLDQNALDDWDDLGPLEESSPPVPLTLANSTVSDSYWSRSLSRPSPCGSVPVWTS